MHRRIAALAASVLVFSFILPTASSIAAKTSPQAISTKNCSATPPKVKLHAAPADPWASKDKKYKGTTITWYGGSVGTDHDADVALCIAFEKSTGIKVDISEMGSSSTTNLGNLEADFQSHSATPSATRLDVVWPGTIGKYLLPVTSWGKPDTGLEIKSILKNDTVGGKLRALPYQGDFGMLYYRKDLLSKYHLKVPKTWTQLASEAKTIQTKMRAAGHKSFWGFFFQGNAYEGLTCDALEWIASYGGGSFINSKGKVTVDNPKAAAALKEAQGWVGKITPASVTTLAGEEGGTASLYASGDVAFARNWPYMYSTAIIGKLVSKTGVAPLPHGPGGKSSATVGGWQVGVNEFTKGKVRAAAEAWVRYFASRPVQIWRAVYAGIVPTMSSVGSVKAVKKAQPFLATVGPKTTRVTRPTILGTRYGQGSTDIWDAVSSILAGGSVSGNLKSLQVKLKALHP